MEHRDGWGTRRGLQNRRTRCSLRLAVCPATPGLCALIGDRGGRAASRFSSERCGACDGGGSGWSLPRAELGTGRSAGDKTQGALKRFSAHPHPEDPLCGAILGCQPASTHCQGNAASQRGLKSLEPVGNGAGRAEIGGLPGACTHHLSLGPSVTGGAFSRDGEGPGRSLVPCCSLEVFSTLLALLLVELRDVLVPGGSCCPLGGTRMADALQDAGEESTAAMMPSQQRAEEGTSFSLKCIKDKKVPIGVTVVIAALLLTIIALAAKKCPSCPSCSSPVLPSCLENGIGYREKCFYFVEDETDWNRSQIFCRSLRAHLAIIDTQEELHFLLRYGSSLHYWIGLHREGSGPWKWSNGSLFSNRFEVRGKGQCAYINADGISSDWCSQLKYSVCSHPQKHPSGIQKDSEILLNFT
uniref:C-type lectin domain-containing protein n=1 Tax=Aquila chrysaetos chrysaetos TaxID=223781 RepID=A0A663F7A3_AQUCH